MSLAFLKIHCLDPNSLRYGRVEKMNVIQYQKTLCGRWAPDWARRTTTDPDFATCESCLDVLVREARVSIEESRMSTVEILDRRG